MIVDEKNLRGSILKLALPAVFENTLMMIVGFVSTALVGRLGKEALSAAGACNSTINFVMVLFVALSTGSTILVARFTGGKKYRLARETARQSVVIGAILSVCLGILFSLFSRQIIELFFGSAHPQVKDNAVQYFRIVALSLPFILINTVISGCHRGMGDTRTPLYVATGVNILNIVLSIMFIYGIPFLNLPGLGIRGAAIGVTLARAFGGIVSLFILTFRKSIIQVRLLKKFRIRWGILYRLYRFGFPATLEQAILQGGFFMVQVLLSMMGTIPMATFSVVNTINSVAYIPTWGFGVAATTLVGQNLGQRRPDLAEKSVWTTGKLSLLINVVLTILLIIFAKPLVMIFNNDPNVVQQGVYSIWLFSLSQPFMAYLAVLQNALRGAGDVFYTMITCFVGVWVFRLGMMALFIFGFGWHHLTIWIAFNLDYAVRVFMYVVRFKRGRWKHIRV